MNPFDSIRKWEKDPEFQKLPRERQEKIYRNFYEKRIAPPEFQSLPEPEKESRRQKFLASRIPEAAGRSGRGSAEASKWEATYRSWNNDPDFQRIPPQRKAHIYSKYFDQNVIGDRAESMTDEEREHLKGRFLRSISREPDYNRTPVQVDQVLDGDTVKLRDGRTVRFRHVDTPEKSQDHGMASRTALERVLSSGKNVSIHTGEPDPYGREIAYVYSDGQLVNQALVESGDAWVYDHFAKGAKNFEELKAVERAAREARKGIWQSQSAQAPWDYRRGLSPDASNAWKPTARSSSAVPDAATSPVATEQSIQKAQPMPSAEHSIADIKALDPVRHLGAAAADFVGSLSWALDRVAPMQFKDPAIKSTAKHLQSAMGSTSDSLRDAQSEAWKASQQKTFLGEGKAWTDPAKLSGTLLGSAPAMVAGMATGAGITTMLINRGVSAGVAGIVGSAMGEGGASAVPAAHDTFKMIMDAPHEIISGTPEYQEAFEIAEGTLTERDKAAREAVADKAALTVGAITGSVVGAAGAPSGHAFGKIIGGTASKGLLSQALKQGILEAGQEGIQSPSEVGIQNIAARRYADPNRPITEGMGEAAVEGMVSGLAMGGGQAVGGRGINRLISPQPPAADPALQDDFQSDDIEAQPQEQAEIQEPPPETGPAPDQQIEPQAEPQPEPVPDRQTQPPADTGQIPELSPAIKAEVEKTLSELGESAGEHFLADDPASQYARAILDGTVQPEPQPEGKGDFGDSGLSLAQRSYVQRRVSELSNRKAVTESFPDPQSDPVDRYAHEIAGLNPAQGAEVVDQVEGQAEPEAPQGPSPSYSINRRDIESVFKGRTVRESDNGSFEVNLPSGTLRIERPERIDIDEAAFEISYGRKLTAGERSYGAAGSYEKGVIKISRIGDRYTLGHESYHHLEAMGHITPAEVQAVNAEIGKPDASYEERAAWIEENLYQRDKYRRKGLVYQAIQKVGDIIDMGKNMMKRSGRSVLRGMESGRLQNRQPDPAHAVDLEADHQYASQDMMAQVKAASDAISKTGKYVPIYKIRRQLGWSKSQFDGVLDAMIRDGTVAAGQDGPSNMTAQDISDSFRDSMGSTFKSITWRKNPQASARKSPPMNQGVNHQDRVDIRSASQATQPGKDYVLISEIRKKLGWSKDRFDQAIDQMARDGTIALHPGNPSNFNIEDLYQDHNGNVSVSFSWRKDPSQVMPTAPQSPRKPPQAPEPIQAKPADVSGQPDIKAVSDKIKPNGKGVPIHQLSRELGWDIPKLHQAIEQMRRDGTIALSRSVPAGFKPADMSRAFKDSKGEQFYKLTWKKSPQPKIQKPESKPAPDQSVDQAPQAIAEAVKNMGGRYVPIHKLRDALGMSKKSFDQAMIKASENGDIMLHGGDPSTMTAEQIEKSLIREKAGRRRDHFLVSTNPNSSPIYSIFQRDQTPEDLKPYFGRKSRTMKDFFREKLELDKDFRTQWLDRLHPLKALIDEKSYKIARMFSDATSTVEQAFEHGGLRWEGELPVVERSDKALVPWLKKLKGDGRNFFYWLAAKRAEQLEIEGREKWLDKDAREKIFKHVGEAPTHPDYETWDDVNAEFQAMNKQILDFAQEAGVFTAEQRVSWEQNYYLPFYRLYDDQVNPKERLLHPQGGNQHLANVIKRLEGGEAKLGDPLENILANWSTLIAESMRNKSRLDAADASQRLGRLSRIKGPNGKPLPLIQEVSGREIQFQKLRDKNWVATFRGEANVISYIRKGKRIFARINDQELFNALTTADAMRMENLVMKMFTQSKRLLTSAATAAPPFRINNMVRDTLHLAVTSKSFVPFLDTAIGFVKVWRQDADVIAYMASGGGMSGSYTRSNDPEAMSKYLQNIYQDKGFIEKVIPFAKVAWDFWGKVGEASELAARVRLYQKRIQEGRSHFEAAFEAKDVIDFTMRGQCKTAQYLIQTVPFLNARIQGLYKLGRAAYENPMSFAIKGGMLSAASLALWGLNRDEEWFQELEDWDKHQYYHFMVNDKRIRLAKPFEVGAIFSTLFTSAASVMAGDEEISYLSEALWTTAFDTLAINPVPQVAKPATELYFNKSMFTDRPIVGMRHRGLPAHLQADPWESETLRATAKTFGFSPKQAKHLINGYTSTYGMALLGLSDIFFRHATDFAEAPEKRIEDYPVVGKFVRELPNRNVKYVTRFYELFDELDKTVRAVNFYRQTGDMELAQKAARKDPRLWANQKNINKVKFDIGEINRQVRMVYHSNRSPEWKRRKIDELTDRKNKLSKIMYERLVD